MKHFVRSLWTAAILLLLCAAFGITALAAAESEDNGTYTTADTISSGVLTTGYISSTSDVDYYKFTAPANGKLSFSFGHTYAESDCDFDVTIQKYDNGSLVEIFNRDVALSDKDSITLPFVGAVKGGVYYLRVKNGWNVSGQSYSVKATFTESNYFEKEFNNSYSTATKVTLGKTYTGVLNTSSDGDYYRIETPANGKLSVSFKHTYAENSDYWYVTLYKYDGELKEIFGRRVNRYDSSSVSLPFTGAVSGGVYFIKVDNGYGVQGLTYLIQTSFTESDFFEKEFNNDYSTATKLSSGKNYTGVLNTGDDIDYYRFVAPANGKLSVSFKHTYAESSSRWYVTLYKYDNGLKEIGHRNIQLNDKSSVSFPFVGAVKNGVYYISVDNGYSADGKTYIVNAAFTASDYYEKEFNNEYSTATKLTANNKYYGTLTNNNDDDYYKFTATHDGFLQLSFKHTTIADSYPRWTVSLYRYKNSDYEKLGSWDVRLSDNASVSLPTYGIKKGDSYYVKVSSGYSDIGGKTYILYPYFTYAAPAGVTLSNGGSQAIKISWKTVTGADGYRIYRATSKTGTYTLIKNITSGSTTSYKNVSGLTNGKTYYYKVRAYAYDADGNIVLGSNSSPVSRVCAVGKVSTLKAAAAGSQKIKLTWSKVTGATGYRIYRATSKTGTYTLIKDITSGSTTSYKNVSGLTNGKTYYYKIAAYSKYNGNVVKGPESAIVSCKATK